RDRARCAVRRRRVHAREPRARRDSCARRADSEGVAGAHSFAGEGRPRARLCESRWRKLAALEARAGDLPMRLLLLGILPHVKWFTDPRPHPTRYDLLLTWPVIGAFVIALVAVGVAYVIQHRVPELKAVRPPGPYPRTGPLLLR